MKVLDLFSGIGGFSLGLEAVGMETIAFCEREPFCQTILKMRWPTIPCHDDISTLDGVQYEGTDVVCGGFPCQDISVGGWQKGIEAERSGLWSELCRIISEVRPRYAIVENVPNLLSGPTEKRGGWFGRVLGDLATVGYDAEWHCIPASRLGAYHIRDRVWIVAHPNGIGRNSLEENEQERPPMFDTKGLGFATQWKHEGDMPDFLLRNVDGFFSKPSRGFERNDDGLSEGMDRLKAYGNSIVPQIAKYIGTKIMEYEHGHA